MLVKNYSSANKVSKYICYIITAIIVSMLAVMFCGVTSAYSITLEEAATKVEKTSNEYNAAVDEQKRLATEIDALTEQIGGIEEKMPECVAKVDEICKVMYKDIDGPIRFFEMIFGVRSLDEAIKIYDSYEKMFEYRSSKVRELADTRNELQTSKDKLGEDKIAADEAVNVTKAALEEATTARKVAQAEARASNAGALASEIDWSMPREEFISHWGDRINKYLSGTKLSGQGENFATAAYENGVDPRWSPAISRIESGCGAACFRPYNAWGWMGASFSSWSEGIYKHVKYLSGPMYGGYLTMKGAATYCPPGGPWYSKVAAEMNRM